MAQTRNLRNGLLILRDGTGTPNELQIPIQDGDLSFTVAKPTFTIRNRGKIDHRRDGDETEMQISFSFKFEQWSYNNANTGISPSDVLLKQGGASAWNSTDPVACGPWAIDLVFRIHVPCTPTSYEQLVFPKFHAESLQFSEAAEANTIQVSGSSLAFVPTRTYV
jgi:hypothetical protein